jgi:hypothetical protein
MAPDLLDHVRGISTPRRCLNVVSPLSRKLLSQATHGLRQKVIYFETALVRSLRIETRISSSKRRVDRSKHSPIARSQSHRQKFDATFASPVMVSSVPH